MFTECKKTRLSKLIMKYKLTRTITKEWMSKRHLDNGDQNGAKHGPTGRQSDEGKIVEFLTTTEYQNIFLQDLRNLNCR
jgi:hypothetical protein